ncbi:oligosaccharide repeat unit polymerase [Exiguobacterium sp. Helios]|uniref:oligosaccharide repeat unit polymerase n=1 Tax=Exiguobacterium sp. Helios TaxID=2735868 RepID=UPI00165E6E09|nr:oligosaccharide repeat unit polymerase [Exiguobacterium sp. Helios]QNR22162.1 oligosaccharide repeat unit polymerase [Exiguobacterium sp. Helios]
MNSAQIQINNKSKIVFLLGCMGVAIYSSNFLNIGNYLPLLIAPVMLFFLISKKIEKQFIFIFFSLVAFTITYSIILIFYGFSSIDAVIGRLLFPPIMFIFGYYIIVNDKSYKKFTKILFVMIVSLSLFGFLSFLKTIYMYGDFDSYILTNGRTAINLWGQNPINATGLNTSLSLGLVLLPLLFLSAKSLKNGNLIKLICLFCFVITIYTAVQLANRTGLLLVPISFVVLYLAFVKINFRKIITSFIIILVILIGYFLYSINFLNIKIYIQSTLMFQRLNSSDLFDDPRLKAWNDTFFGLFVNPMGGRKTHLSLNFAHNLWLDIGLDVGVIPLLFLLMFTIFSFLSLRKFMELPHPKFLKALVILLYTAFFVSFMVEPIMQGWVVYFTLFCFLFGVVQRINQEVSN